MLREEQRDLIKSLDGKIIAIRASNEPSKIIQLCMEIITDASKVTPQTSKLNNKLKLESRNRILKILELEISEIEHGHWLPENISLLHNNLGTTILMLMSTFVENGIEEISTITNRPYKLPF